MAVTTGTPADAERPDSRDFATSGSWSVVEMALPITGPEFGRVSPERSRMRLWVKAGETNELRLSWNSARWRFISSRPAESSSWRNFSVPACSSILRRWASGLASCS